MRFTLGLERWNRRGSAALFALGLFGAAIASPVYGQDKTAPAKTVPSKAAPSKAGAGKTAELPSAEKILDEYAVATGAKDRVGKFKTRRSEGVFEMKAAGVEGKLLLLQAQPNKILVFIELPGIGKIQSGFDGKTAWEDSVISGGRTLEGEERDQLVRRALFEGDAEWRKIYDKVTTTGEAKVGDRDAWVVELKPIGSDKPQINYYDKESNLLLRMTMTALTPMGEIEVNSDVLDYRDVDGVKMPFETRQSMLGQTQTMRLTKITHDAVIEDSEFAKK